jgi:hypothetical protein
VSLLVWFDLEKVVDPFNSLMLICEGKEKERDGKGMEDVVVGFGDKSTWLEFLM